MKVWLPCTDLSKIISSSWLFRMTTFQIIELALLVAMYLIDQLNIWPFKVGHVKCAVHADKTFIILRHSRQ